MLADTSMAFDRFGAGLSLALGRLEYGGKADSDWNRMQMVRVVEGHQCPLPCIAAKPAVGEAGPDTLPENGDPKFARMAHDSRATSPTGLAYLGEFEPILF
ncbi:MAG: hypothetical protein P1U82_20280 [Verrucomicrobiales bacterium]|nr:hypothetical protein [Verrucomicrobiales bacterium]